ncbi:MAG: ABC transporter substrate-binding protein [Pseudonocardiaceae bacterium]
MIKQLVRGMTVPAVLALVVAGCGAPADVPDDANGGGQADGFPVTVENCGRTLTFDRPPERVVTGYHPVFETMVELGLGDRIIGRTNFEENGPEGFLPGHKKVYDAVPEISETIDLPQKEVLVAQQPDFVIDLSYAAFDAAEGLATVEELDAVAAATYITAGGCGPQAGAVKLDDIFADFRTLGAIFGVPEQAAELIARYQALLDDVEQRVRDREPVDVLAIWSGAEPIGVFGGGSLIDQMIEIAGGHNVLGDLDEDYPEISSERIAVTRPEAVLVGYYDLYFGERQPSAQQKAQAVFSVVPESPAAQRNRYLPVRIVDTNPGPGSILAISKIAEFLHPEGFTR